MRSVDRIRLSRRDLVVSSSLVAFALGLIALLAHGAALQSLRLWAYHRPNEIMPSSLLAAPWLVRATLAPLSVLTLLVFRVALGNWSETWARRLWLASIVSIVSVAALLFSAVFCVGWAVQLDGIIIGLPESGSP